MGSHDSEEGEEPEIGFLPFLQPDLWKEPNHKNSLDDSPQGWAFDFWPAKGWADFPRKKGTVYSVPFFSSRRIGGRVDCPFFLLVREGLHGQIHQFAFR